MKDKDKQYIAFIVMGLALLAFVALLWYSRA